MVGGWWCDMVRISLSPLAVDCFYGRGGGHAYTRTQAVTHRSVLISPLWHIMRSGCARSQEGKVLVEKREWTSAMCVTKSGSCGECVCVCVCVCVGGGVDGERPVIDRLIDTPHH